MREAVLHPGDGDSFMEALKGSWSGSHQTGGDLPLTRFGVP